MKTIVKILPLALIIMSSTTGVFAQTSSVEITQKLYSTINQYTTSGVDSSGKPRFLILLTPGILLDPAADLDPGKTDLHLFSTILDRAPSGSWIYMPKNMTAYDEYARVIKYHQPPQFQLTSDQKKQLKAAQKILYADVGSGTPSDEYKQFKAKRTALIYASNAVDMFQSANPKTPVPPDLASALQDAYDDYNLFGKANEVLTAEATVQQLQSLNPNEWWGELQNKMQSNQKLFNGTPFGPLSFFPDYSVWFDKTKSWTGVSLTESKIEQSNTSSHTSVGGGFSGSWGLWSVGGSWGQETTRTSSQFTGTNVAVNLEMTQVGVQRDWMDDLVFHSNAWQWGSGVPDCSLISDGGDANQGVTPKGQMPFLITGLLLARNVSLTGTWSSDLKTTYDSMTRGGGSIGWGPFSFGGGYLSTEHTDYNNAQISGSTITFADPQLIGFFVEILPLSPNPSPTLKFGSAPCTNQPLQPQFALQGAAATNPQPWFVERGKKLLDSLKGTSR